MLLATFEFIRALKLVVVSGLEEENIKMTKPNSRMPARTNVIGFVPRNDLCGPIATIVLRAVRGCSAYDLCNPG